MARNIFEWTAVLTWVTILVCALTYGGLYQLNVIDHPQETIIKKIPDRHPQHQSNYQVATWH